MEVAALMDGHLKAHHCTRLRLMSIVEDHEGPHAAAAGARSCSKFSAPAVQADQRFIVCRIWVLKQVCAGQIFAGKPMQWKASV